MDMKSHTVTEVTTFLEVLPLELLPRILLNLDSFSLRSLLRAYPSIARQCILLFEEWEPLSDKSVPVACACFFRNCHGLRELPFQKYDPELHPSLFKIYEASSLSLNDQRLGSPIHERFPYIDKRDSFVHFSSQGRVVVAACWLGDPYLPQEHGIAVSLCQEGIAFQIARERVIEKEFNMMPTTPALSSSLQNSFLYAISLEGVEKIESLTLPPSVVSLTLVFNKSNKHPLIRNLAFTGALACLMIYYHDRVPFIQDVRVPGLGPEYAEVNLEGCCVGNTLVLAHIPSTAGNLTNALPPHPDESRDLSYISQELSGKFGCLVFTGGPNNIVGSWDFMKKTHVSNLFWKQTCQYLVPQDRLTEITGRLDPLCSTFRFETVLDDPIVPAFIGQDITFKTICITSHHGLDFHRFARDICCDSLEFLYIHVTTQDSSDHIPSIDDLSESLEAIPDDIWGLGIVGLRRTHNTTPTQEKELESRVLTGVFKYFPSYEDKRVSLIN